jgi:hypothetical protein
MWIAWISHNEEPCNLYSTFRVVTIVNYKCKEGKAIPLQAWKGREVSRRTRLLDFKTMTHEGGKVVSPTHRPPLPPRNIPGTHVC